MKSKNKTNQSENPIIIPFILCISCGKAGKLKSYSFEYQQESSIAQFSKLAGNGIDVILGYFLAKTHKVVAMFCLQCGRRFEKIDFVGQVSHLIFVLCIFAAIILAMIVDSVFSFETSFCTFGLGILTAIGVRMWSQYYKWKYTPKIKKVDEHFVMVQIPGKGKTKFSRN